MTAWPKACELRDVQGKSFQFLYFGLFFFQLLTQTIISLLFLIVPTTTEGFTMSWVEIIYFLNIKILNKLHGYTVHQQYWTLFYYQPTHTTLKNIELLKHFKISKNAPTCFGLQGNHLQGAKVSTLLKVTRLVKSRYVKDVQGVVSVMAAYCDL